MQEHKLTRSDIGRGLVVLDNLSQQYVWHGSSPKPVKEKAVKFDECTT